MDVAAAEILATYGEKPTQALSALFNVTCPGLGGIVIKDSIHISDKIGRIWTAKQIGDMIDVIEQADLSCDEAKAGFQIHIYLLPDLNQVT